MNPSIDHNKKTRETSKNGAKNEDFSLYSNKIIAKIKTIPKSKAREIFGKKKTNATTTDKRQDKRNG